MSSPLPPVGPPPGGAEYLEPGSGDPVGSPLSRNGGKVALVAGGVIGLAAIGGGVWAAMSFLATGPQPAEALPDTTIGYVSVDLAPGGGQKIEALRTLRKFEAFRDEVGLETDDDVREVLFEEGLADSCEQVDYEDDVEPWLGDRAAAAAVDTGEEEPVPVIVLQVRDADAAETGLAALRDCAGEDQLAWSVAGDWAVLAEDRATADRVVDDAADAPLSEDGDFTRWTGEAGDAGIATIYAAPAAGAIIADFLGAYSGVGGAPASSYDDPTASPDGFGELPAAFEDFDGMAATLRFDDGSLELEVAAGSGATHDLQPTDDGGDLVGSLPEETAVALGLGLGEGWFDSLLQGFAADSGGSDPEALVEGLTGIPGLELPEDIETLTEDGLAVAVGEDLDPDAVFTGETGSLPVAVKMRGDADEIESVLDKVAGSSPIAGELLGRTVEGDTVVVGPDETWREEVASEGSLGDSDRFTRVVREADDASGVVYVDFDAGFLADLAGDDDEVARNLEPLSAVGVSSWLDGDVSHIVVRLSTD